MYHIVQALLVYCRMTSIRCDTCRFLGSWGSAVTFPRAGDFGPSVRWCVISTTPPYRHVNTSLHDISDLRLLGGPYRLPRLSTFLPCYPTATLLSLACPPFDIFPR